MERRYRWPESWPNWIAMLLSVGMGASLGVFLRIEPLLPGFHLSNAGSIAMTATFLMLGPFAIGYLTIYMAEKARPAGWVSWLFLPWPAVLAGAAVACALKIEGLICVVFALPILFVFSTLGGIAAGLSSRHQRRRRGLSLTCIAILPMLLGPIETRLKPPVEKRVVATEIVIHAPAPVVWRNIERVRPIAPAELRETWAHAIGFPRPVEATLSREGVGGVRHASFEHGLMFIETITQWDPGNVLAFSIRADTAHIPATTLDEHVTIGGRYFDVLDGEYRLERLPDGAILLHLSSEERLSTDFNGYAGGWSDLVMSTLQESILQVVKERCEAGAR